MLGRFKKMDTASYTFQASSETMCASQLLEFKTSLIEAVAELHMGRAAKIQYEEQISKVLLEKQDLLWQNETLTNQAKNLDKQHTEAMDALKKQFQAKMCAVEEEKGQIQLAVETKGKEICSFKEDLKTLQLLNYNLQKKLHDMEQKAQLHVLAKEDHIKQLSEFERCYANITCQFGITKEMHEKLEQNVQEAIQQNQKLMSENKEKKSESDHLREELRKNSVELMKYKVMCEKQADEEKHVLIEKEQQLRELQNKLLMEAEINKKISEANLSLKDEKQEALRSLQNMMELIQRYTQTIQKLEHQLTALEKDYQTLERDNELQRAKAKENEEKFLALQREHEKALEISKKQEKSVTCRTDINSEEVAAKELKHSQELISEDMRTIALPQDQEHTSSMVPELEQNLCKSHCLQSENTAEHDQDKSMETHSENCSLGAAVVRDMLGEASACNETSTDLNCSQCDNVKENKSFCEEQKDEFSIGNNKVKFPASEDTIKQPCEVEGLVDIAALSRNAHFGADNSTPFIKDETTLESAKVPADNAKPLADCSEQQTQPEDSFSDKYGDDRSDVALKAGSKDGRNVQINKQHKQDTKLSPLHLSAKANVTAGKNVTCLIKAGNPYQSIAQNWGPLELNIVSSKRDVYDQYQTDLKGKNPREFCSNIPAGEETYKDDRDTFLSNKEEFSNQIFSAEESPSTPPITVPPDVSEKNRNLRNTPDHSLKSHSLLNPLNERHTGGPTVCTKKRILDYSRTSGHGNIHTNKSDLRDIKEISVSGHNSTACPTIRKSEQENPKSAEEATNQSVVSYSTQEQAGGNVPVESHPTIGSGKPNSPITAHSGAILSENIGEAEIVKQATGASALPDHPLLKSYQSEEWNTVVQTYRDASERQTSVSPELPLEAKVGHSCSKLKDKISEIEKLLLYQRFSGGRKRKLAADTQTPAE